MKKTVHFQQSIIFLVLVLGLSSCAHDLVTGDPGDVERGTTEDKIVQLGVENGDQAVPPLNELIAPPLFRLPDNLAAINSDNANDIDLLGNVYPAQPQLIEITPDGRLSAIGASSGITVVKTDSGEVISEYKADFPDCGFGFSRYFQFNEDGSFIAIITKEEIQVWQIGGGLIYANPHTRAFIDQFLGCGFDIPQLALSPDGQFLAISGIDYSRPEPARFFRIVNIIQNETLYEWDGKDDTLHGNLGGYQGLGFSKDGSLLQTLDPRRFIIANGEMHRSFRFWSVGDWVEVTAPDIISTAFDPGDLLFPLANEGTISIVERPTGGKVSEVSAPGCDWDKPCEFVFSDDGSKALVLSPSEPVFQFGQRIFYPAVEIWDLDNQSMLESIQGVFLNLHGLSVTDDGELVGRTIDSAAIVANGLWWTFPEYFQGLSANVGGAFSFVPTWAETGRENDCRYCDNCRLHLSEGFVECQAGIENPQGSYSIDVYDNEYWLVKHYPDDVGQVGKLSRQPAGDLADERVRLLGFSEEFQTAFYCLDAEYRQQSCLIDALSDSRVAAELNDISYLHISPDGRTAAFIDKSSSSLDLFRFDTQKLSRKSHFQAKAAKINPLFSEDGQLIFYLVENLRNSKDFSLEIMDAESQKVLKRVALKSDIELPVAFSVTSGQTIWAVAEKTGRILLFAADDGRLITALESDQEEILGVAFDNSRRVLVSLNSAGVFKVWGIEK